MKRLRVFRSRLSCSIIASLTPIVLATFSSVSCATPIQWHTGSGANQHYYEFVAPTGGIFWHDAKVAAEAASLEGVQGHLVTITTPEEWQFILQQFPVSQTWIGLTDEVQEGDFRWVTGEPFSFNAWATSPQEPNNAGNEDYVYYEQRFAGIAGWGWNDKRDERLIEDLPDRPTKYVVEYDTVPEPSTLLLALLGWVAIAVSACRRPTLLRLGKYDMDATGFDR